MNPYIRYAPAAHLARENKISRQRLTQLAQQGKVKFVHIGRALLIDRRSLERYLTAHGRRREEK